MYFQAVSILNTKGQLTHYVTPLGGENDTFICYATV